MHYKDKKVKEICSINFKDEGFILEKVINGAGDTMFTLVASNDKYYELYSCYESRLGDMLTDIILSKEQS